MEAAQLIGREVNTRTSLKAVLGTPRMRRDRLQRLADALDDPFLDDILADQLWFSRIAQILPAQRRRTYDVEVEGLHNLVVEDVVVHNCAPPFRTAEFDILFGFGISREGSLIDLGVEQNIVRKSGAWYTYEGDQLGQGKENARSFLRDNPDLANEIEKKIKEKLGVGPRIDAEATDKEPAAGARRLLSRTTGAPAERSHGPAAGRARWVGRLVRDRPQSATFCRRLLVRLRVQARANAELFLDLLLDLVGHIWVVTQEVPRVLLALPELLALVGVPGTGLAHDGLLHPQVDQATLPADAEPEQYVEFSCAEWGGAVVHDHALGDQVMEALHLHIEGAATP